MCWIRIKCQMITAALWWLVKGNQWSEVWWNFSPQLVNRRYGNHFLPHFVKNRAIGGMVWYFLTTFCKNKKQMSFKNLQHHVIISHGPLHRWSIGPLPSCYFEEKVLANYPTVRSDFFHANLLCYVLYFQLLKDCWQLVGTFFEQLELQGESDLVY